MMRNRYISNRSIWLIISILFVELGLPAAPAHSIPRSFTIGINELVVDAAQLGVAPDDTLFLEAGKRHSLRIRNVKGDSLHYVIITAKNGEMIVENDDFHYGFVLSNCKFFRLSGNLNNENSYGIRILKTGKGASGLSIGELSTNYEIDHIEIANTGFAGIFAFSQPTCDLTANSGHFEQRNTIIHHNYIHNTFGEGMYLGHSFYTGYTISCDNQPLVAYPHEIKGLKVYDNILQNIGYDGIQISSVVEGAEVYNNKIYNYGTEMETMQHSGIQIGAGTKIRCFNNLILQGSGTGIMMFGLGNSYIYNNVIANAGQNFFPNDASLRIYGILVDDRLTYPNTSHYIFNNTIIRPKSDGIWFISTQTTANVIANNLIVKPGSVYIYQPENSRFINVKEGADVKLLNNFYTDYWSDTLNMDSVKSIQHCFEVLPISKRGIDSQQFGVNFDFNYETRSDTPTIGAFEYKYDRFVYSKTKSDIVFSQDVHAGIITVENKSAEVMRSLIISDLTGRQLYALRINEPQFFLIDFKRWLKKGIYICSIKRDFSTVSNKFIVSAN